MKIKQWTIKSTQQIANIRESWKYLNELLLLIKEKAKVWIATIELEFVAERFIKSHNLKGAFKWYDGFPANLCLSVNDCVVHGVPDETILKAGDLLKIDAGLIYQKGYSDSAVSMVIGWEMANPSAYDLIKTTKEALDESIQEIKPYHNLRNYAWTVEKIVKESWYKIIKDLTGHWVGNMVHERPYIFNYAKADMKQTFAKPGMVLCCEPITGVMSDDFVEKPNDMGLYTKYWDVWAQWEYMLLMTEGGYEILSGIMEL